MFKFNECVTIQKKKETVGGTILVNYLHKDTQKR